MRIVGLMSGTSGDGVDAALLDIDGKGRDITRWDVLAFHSYAYSGQLRDAVRTVAEVSGTVDDAARLNVLLGEEFAKACTKIIREANLTPADIDLIGSHGHTIRHIPPTGKSRARQGMTLQIGEPAIIAERTGVPVVSHFRGRDMAAGGQGAPLVPLADFLLFRDARKTRALQNIGGIANVTLLPAGAESVDDILAFDTGPGNMILDAAARAVSGGRYPYDKNGRLAKGRAPDEKLLTELLRHPYFRKKPPKSTGREMFGEPFTQPLLARARSNSRKRDVLATMTALVAHSIRQSYAKFLDPHYAIDEIIVSGGGVKNLTLMRRLRELCAPIPVLSSRDIGVHPDAKEAVAFAVLARECWEGRSGNVPAATGAAGARRLGLITYP